MLGVLNTRFVLQPFPTISPAGHRGSVSEHRAPELAHGVMREESISWKRLFYLDSSNEGFVMASGWTRRNSDTILVACMFSPRATPNQKFRRFFWFDFSGLFLLRNCLLLLLLGCILSRTQSAINSCATEQILLERRGAMLKLCRLTAADTQSNTCSANNAVQQVLCARVHVYHVFGQNLAALLIGSCVYFCNSVGV